VSESKVKERIGTYSTYIGPVDIDIPVIVDYSAAILHDFVCGANDWGYYYSGVNWSRDIGSIKIYDIRNVEVGDLSPNGGIINQRNGIEVGHIFKLGDIYSKAMNANILNANGERVPLIMGCYGFGVTRLIAATIEQLHDEKGIVWPQSIAPYDVVIIPINMYKSDKIKEITEFIYNKLMEVGFDVLLNDKREQPGSMFANADLIGIPHQIIISEHSIDNNFIEYKCRKSKEKSRIPKDINSIIEYLVSKNNIKKII
jgi:prolyl-tRNA synthetase